MTRTVTLRSAEQLRDIDDAIDEALSVALESIGVRLVTESQQAFTEQAWDGEPWLPRYPGQKGQKLNIAGALGDLESGPTVKARRYDDRPALRDEGTLSRSISRKTDRDSVTVGTDVPYAMKHMVGGETRIDITDVIRQNAEVWMRRKDYTSRGSPQREAVLAILATDAYEFSVVRRPFLGVTDRSARDFVELVEEAFANAIVRMGT